MLVGFSKGKFARHLCYATILALLGIYSSSAYSQEVWLTGTLEVKVSDDLKGKNHKL